MRCILTIMFSLVSTNAMVAQLECNGSIYRVIEKETKVTTLQKVILDVDSDILQFEDLKEYSGHQLNAICFKPDANSIYGIKYGNPYHLFRISDNLELEILRLLPLPTDLFFVAGDIMPDGRHMVVLGYGGNEQSNILAIIDLDDPNFATTLLPLRSLGNAANVVCADIAFHPTTGLLYGFDQKSNRMIRIDIQDRSISLFEEESSTFEIGIVPSMFFDHNGELFGFTLGTRNNRLVQFDKDDGSGEEKFELDIGGSQDACSCPFQVGMFQTINNINQYTCTESQFTIKLVNRTPLVQSGMSLVDTLPIGMTIKSIDYNPFNSTSNLSSGSGVLSLTDFDLPIGIDSIVYTVSISPDATLGYHRNQAWLIKENPDLRSNLREPLPSDDPATVEKGDPTGFILEDLTPDVANEQMVLCVGDVKTLAANIHGVDRYEWNTGQKGPEIQINDPGFYEVRLFTSCGTGSLSFDVSSAYLSVDLGPDLYIDVNENVALLPEIENSSDIATLIWNESNDIHVLSCYTCLETSARVPVDMAFKVSLLSDEGCVASDMLSVYVDNPRHYFASGFSPNGDGNNDIFYLQSKKDYSFKDFMIFDRWGNRIFIAKKGIMNDPSYGWNGKAGNQALKPGVFVWSAEIIGNDGQIAEVHGGITLVR